MAIPSSTLIPSLTILLLSLPLLFLLLSPRLSRQMPPISLPDELHDIALFRSASADLPRHRFPSARSRLSSSLRRPRIAFLFLTNSPLHFAPLWERLFSGAASPRRYNIYVHADPLVKIPQPVGIFTSRVIPSRRTQRSSPTLISAARRLLATARRLLATALLDDPANAYFALISQTCIPLHSFNYLYNILFDFARLSPNLEFPSYIEILDNEATLPARYNARGKNVMIPEVRFEDFRVGSQFFILSRKHALTVIKDSILWRKFKLPCLNVESCYPEEHYFPTLLLMKDLDGCSRFTLTRVNWTYSVNGHPHTYRPPEVSAELIHTLRESNSSYSYMFARKFSPDCLGPLMGIADSVIFRDL